MEQATTATQQRRRRYHRSAQEIESLLAEYQSSGQSRRNFAALRGISLSTLSGWLQRRGAGAAVANRSSQRLVRVRVAGAPGGESIMTGAFEVAFGDGVMVRVPHGFDELSLRRLLHALGKGC